MAPSAFWSKGSARPEGEKFLSACCPRTARRSPARSTAPTSALSISPLCSCRTAVSSERMPELSSLERVKLGPPKRNSRAMRLATMLPRAPMVRLAFNGGPASSRSCAVQAASSCGDRSLPSSLAHAAACCASDQRKLKLVLLRSKAMPMKTPDRRLSSRSRPASAMAPAALLSIRICWGSISSISRGGIRN